MSTQSPTVSRHLDAAARAELDVPIVEPVARPDQASAAGRVLAFAYGLACYAAFFATYLYAMGFVTDFFTPTRLDEIAPAAGPTAWLVNLGLLAVFAIQHSVMARPGFKKWWTQFVPQPVERSTYVLFTSLALALLFALWQPMGGVVWEASSTAGRAALLAVGLSGWALVFYATCLLNHFDLFGLRQVWLHLRGRPYTPLKFKTPSLYRFVRHPLYIGWLLALWGAPTMTVAHLVFAGVSTIYILVAIQFEERDLMEFLGEDYRAYRRRVPMLVPIPIARGADEDAA